VSVRLRYTGERAVSFQAEGTGHAGPGDEFSVPDELAAGFLRRADIEHAGDSGGTDAGADAGEAPPRPDPEDAGDGGDGGD